MTGLCRGGPVAEVDETSDLTEKRSPGQEIPVNRVNCVDHFCLFILNVELLGTCPRKYSRALLGK